MEDDSDSFQISFNRSDANSSQQILFSTACIFLFHGEIPIFSQMLGKDVRLKHSGALNCRHLFEFLYSSEFVSSKNIFRSSDPDRCALLLVLAFIGLESI